MGGWNQRIGSVQILLPLSLGLVWILDNLLEQHFWVQEHLKTTLVGEWVLVLTELKYNQAIQL
jgi:hypothetical protein